MASLFRSVSQPVAGLPSQSAKPASQTQPLWAQCMWGPQVSQTPVQLLSSPRATHSPPQKSWLASHWMPQLVPSQVALPFSGTRHGSQRLPQVEVLESEAQALPQRWYASRHAKSQLMPIGVLVQAGTELAGPAGHGSQALPQVAAS